MAQMKVPCPGCKAEIPNAKLNAHLAQCVEFGGGRTPSKGGESAGGRGGKDGGGKDGGGTSNTTMGLMPPCEDGRIPCARCGRKFSAERIASHQYICTHLKNMVPSKAGGAEVTPTRVGTHLGISARLRPPGTAVEAEAQPRPSTPSGTGATAAAALRSKPSAPAPLDVPTRPKTANQAISSCKQGQLHSPPATAVARPAKRPATGRTTSSAVAGAASSPITAPTPRTTSAPTVREDDPDQGDGPGTRPGTPCRDEGEPSDSAAALLCSPCMTTEDDELQRSVQAADGPGAAAPAPAVHAVPGASASVPATAPAVAAAAAAAVPAAELSLKAAIAAASMAAAGGDTSATAQLSLKEKAKLIAFELSIDSAAGILEILKRANGCFGIEAAGTPHEQAATLLGELGL